MKNKVYCHHCRVEHPREEMRLVITKNSRHWRCKHSIEAAKNSLLTPEEFGRKVTAANKADARVKLCMRLEKTEASLFLK